MDGVDDGWRAKGLLYFNADDPTVWVRKRVGWGWTLNFARGESWALLASICAVSLWWVRARKST